MLDADTKRRIDTARDILVGKVPDPKSQVEQITIAMIYKFMDDIDSLSEEMGGERSFFADEFEQYGWARLMQPGIGGHEMLGLYSEAVVRMDQNAGIPQLFRNIFSNAFLPFRDSETLRAFLKVIDGFTYDHSERLGDAFEYLLSVMDSQGDAGQFRTPRHIIDFMVSIVDPKKENVILDPACGTGGFLISSYKHILATNTDADGNSTLTPDERDRLARNLVGYDISPDMVRLSRVNMYLHGLVDPHISEYDTLTSEGRWNEYADVILANPPFMSPKGGIKPHNLFTFKAKKSEVLFVDYISGHLNSGGRAGIIVPEGIIFKGEKAYMQLRKKLVDESLVAVVSLPAGVFNPYSGVKTSILLLDKALARRTEKIAFFKVENDGFDLGAKRLPIDENDLPEVKDEITSHLRRLRDGEKVGSFQPAPTLLQPERGEEHGESESGPRFGLIVDRNRIVENEECNLSLERYRVNHVLSHSFPMVSLGDDAVFRVESGGTPKSTVEEYWNGDIAWATLVDLPANNLVSEILSTRRTISATGLAKSSATLLPENAIVVSTRATIGKIGINRIPLATNQGFKNIVILDSKKAIPEFVALMVTRLVPTMETLASGGTFKEISKSLFCQLEVPLPPLDLQREIVAEIEGYQKVIDGARAVVENYRPHIHVDPEWPMARLQDICDSILSGGTPSTKVEKYWKGDIPWITSADIVSLKTAIPRRFITKQAIEESATNLIKRGNIIVVTRVGLGKLFRNDFDVCISQDSQALILRDGINADFLVNLLRDKVEEFKTTSQGSTIQGVTKRRLAEIEIALPPLSVQNDIVAEIDCDQDVVDANRSLVQRFEHKIEDTIARVWGEAHDSPND